MKKVIYSIILVIISASLSIGFYYFFLTPKLGFINSNELVYGYKGMQEAHQQYQIKEQKWQSNLDTLKRDLSNAVKLYQNEYKSLSKEERIKREQLLAEQQRHFEKYSEEIATFAREEDTKMTQGVLNQVNTFIQEYGKEHGYTMIFGTTNDGSLIYGNEAKDLTKIILKEMNEKY